MKRGHIDVVGIIRKYYEPGSLAYNLLIGHSTAVAQKALVIAGRLMHMKPDMIFTEEAAMLHDIGIFGTNVPSIGCYGDKPYVCHGYLGREVLESEGLPVHALVCERHVGVGISVADIDRNGLPIPRRDMLPVTLEERIICFADKFFSKKKDSIGQQKPLEEVKRDIERYGPEKMERFEEMLREFGE
ncbi:MAG: HD domain-containing protein [Acidobacteriota bacterium]